MPSWKTSAKPSFSPRRQRPRRYGAWPRCKNWPTNWSAAKWKCCWFSAATPYTRRRPICISASGSARRRRPSTSGCIKTRRPRSVNWHIPEAHYLETWGDGRAHDGTASIAQPLIAPLYAGRSATEFLSALADESPRSGHDLVRDHWQRETHTSGGDFERFWRQALNDGVIAEHGGPGVRGGRDEGLGQAGRAGVARDRTRRVGNLV